MLLTTRRKDLIAPAKYVFSASDLKGNAIGWFNIYSNTQLKQRGKKVLFCFKFFRFVCYSKQAHLLREWVTRCAIITEPLFVFWLKTGKKFVHSYADM